MVDELLHAVLQHVLGLEHRLRAAPDLGVEVGEREVRPEVGLRHRVAGRIGQADHADEDVVGQLDAHVARGRHHGVADHDLGVDQEAVHVEDDGADRTREDHAAGLAARPPHQQLKPCLSR